MSFRTELAKIALAQMNLKTLVQFEEMTKEIDLFDTAVAEFNGVILQLLFPNPVAGYPKFKLLKSDIALPEPTTFFKNSEGDTDLTVHEVIELINAYIQEVNKMYNGRNNI